MRPEDADAVEQLSDLAFHELDVRTHRQGWPTPQRRTPQASARWAAWARHIAATDPGGCFVAEVGGGVGRQPSGAGSTGAGTGSGTGTPAELVGAVAALRRDLTWILSSFFVRPGHQGQGSGRQLLDAALTHGRGCLRGLVSSSDDPAALRRYRSIGFTLHPTMVLRGTVDRAALPVVDRVREGTIGDADLMNSVDRQVRDAAHGPDHDVLAAEYRLVVADRPTGQGYAYLRPDGSPYLLAATNRRTAVDLLWEALASTTPDTVVEVPHVTAANAWAVDVGMTARLDLLTQGFLGVRHQKPPEPYLPSGRFL